MSGEPPYKPSLPKRPALASLAAQSLREGIAAGLWQSHLPGVRELSETLQVSRRTLHAALEELRRQGIIEVRERCRSRVVSALGTRSEVSAVRTIGVLMPVSHFSMQWPMTFVLDTLRQRLDAAGYKVQFHIQPNCYARNPAGVLGRFIAAHRASAWMVLSAHARLQRWMATQNVPFLVLGSAVPGISIPSVDTDFRALCYHAGCTLKRKGHRSIALVLTEGEYGGDLASEEGLRQAMQAKPVAECSVLRHAGNATSICAALDRSLRSPNPPTAFVVARAAHVLTVMMHLMLRGRHIPRDAAVLSRDNDPILEAASPSVARYGIEPRRLANRIAKALQVLADGGVIGQPQIRLTPEFFPGASV